MPPPLLLAGSQAEELFNHRYTQMHTDRSARFKVFVQLRTRECAAGGWFRSVYLCASVYLWLKSLASLVRYGVGGTKFSPPPSNPMASACNRLRDNCKNTF